MDVKIIQGSCIRNKQNYIKAMSNLIINKHKNIILMEIFFPPKVQCQNQFKKCPCLNYE